MAIELGTRGVRVLVAEQSARAGRAPRAKTTNVRTRTHLRRWGLAGQLADASPLGIAYPNDVMFVTRLGEYRLAHFKDAFNAAPDRCPWYPEHAQWIPQYTLEKVLRKHAQSLPNVELRFDASLRSAEAFADGVVGVLEAKDGEQSRVAARYLVGADGARSIVRKLIGANMVGRYGLSRNYNIVFRAPGLAQAHSHGRAVMYWQTSRHGASLIGPMDSEDIWFFMPTGMKEGETLSNEQAAQAIKLATGIDLPYEIISTDEWIASTLLADRYSAGPIFLVGDACHLHPPFGGYGMNMGIGDSVDLGWKMAATLQRWGGPGLIASYESERRPVHEIVMAEAVANHTVLGGQLWHEGLEDDTPEGEARRTAVGAYITAVKSREFNTLGTVLGIPYEHSSIILNENVAPAPRDGQHYTPDARPGSLAPHAWLADGRSIYDSFGQGFALIVSEKADHAQVVEAQRQASDRQVPLTVVHPHGVDVTALYRADLVLVRPDQHVAWRGAQWNENILPVVTGWPIDSF